jgi:hypothetical protein
MNGFNGNGFPGLKLPGVKMVTLRDIVAQIGALCDRIPGLAVVIIAGKKGDFENMRMMSNNLPYEMKREMVARVHDGFAAGNIKAE